MKWSDNKNSALMSRIGLGIFFLVFGLLKITNTTFFVEGPYKMFYGLLFPGFLVLLVGAVQIIMAVGFFSNSHTRQAAWLAVIMLGATVIATLPKILTTFQLPPAEGAPGFLFVAAIPIFFMALSEALKE